MREIKFRAWDDFRKRMLYDVVSFDQCEGYIGINVVTPMTNKITAIMQFTGLKDSEDVEIWEGDTVRVCIEQLFDDVEKVGVIIYEAPAFKVDFPDVGVTIGIVDEYSMTVIGNIYEPK